MNYQDNPDDSEPPEASCNWPQTIIPGLQDRSYGSGYLSRRPQRGPKEELEPTPINEEGSNRINGSQYRCLPYERGSIRDTQPIWQAYQLFNIDNPVFSAKPKEVHAQQLRATVEYFCAFNESNERKAFVREIARRSILEEGFNDRYSKLYKYCRQCYFAEIWEEPPTFPFPEGILGISTWKQFRRMLRKMPEPATPEILIPPELLYPWSSPRPEDIEYLLEEQSFNQLNVEMMEEIILDLLIEPKRKHTVFDFVITQTNTKSCVDAGKELEVEKLFKSGNKATTYKYVGVTKWIDAGMPLCQPIAVRTPVWKRPTEYRDAITLNPYTLYQVWELNQVLKNMMTPAIGVGDFIDSNDLLKFTRKHSLFIMTDWKKSGLTIPHWFVELVITCIRKKGSNVVTISAFSAT